MIKTFRCKDTEALYEGGNPLRFRAIQAQAQRKLEMLDATHAIEDLRSPPGNRLEKLSGDPRRTMEYTDQRPMACVLPLLRWSRL